MNLLVIFDPELGKEYEYSNNLLNSDNEDLDDEKEKDKTYFEMLKYCLESIKSILKNIFNSPVKYLIEYGDNRKNNIKNI